MSRPLRPRRLSAMSRGAPRARARTPVGTSWATTWGWPQPARPSTPCSARRSPRTMQPVRQPLVAVTTRPLSCAPAPAAGAAPSGPTDPQGRPDRLNPGPVGPPGRLGATANCWLPRLPPIAIVQQAAAPALRQRHRHPDHDRAAGATPSTTCFAPGVATRSDSPPSPQFTAPRPSTAPPSPERCEP
jgi:hypothetical protein